MSVSIRLVAYLVLPLLLAVGSFLAMSALGDSQGSPLLLGVKTGISALLALLPALLYRFFVHCQLQQGFAHMADGRVLLPNELGIRELVGDNIRYWQSYEQPLATTVRLQGSPADLLVGISITLTLWPDEHGKKFARHIDEALPLLEVSAQECVYLASRQDHSLAGALDGSVLLNEEDERVLKSKFLSALETLAIKGVFFPHEAAGIHIDRNVTKIPRLTSSANAPAELEEADLLLDTTLQESVGLA